MDYVIKTQNLTKHFGKVQAVVDVSLCVKQGEIYGFLGLNGAGKTTTIRMLLDMIRPTSGEFYLNHKKIHTGEHAIWNKVGYLVEISYAYPELTVRENLEIIRRLRLLPDPGVVDGVIERLQLGPYKDRKAKDLSLGNAQRLGLAKAIIHNPKILILDEPANGLDPAGIVEIRELLLDLATNHGVTIFISSHILGEISKFATRIGIIHQGRLIQELDTEQLGSFRKKRLIVSTKDQEGAKSILIKNDYVVTITTAEGFLEIVNEEAITHPELVNTLLVQAGYPPGMLRVEVEDLESYFLRVIGNRGAEL
jgi:ABC-2 type transport system ATP-binding protein